MKFLHKFHLECFRPWAFGVQRPLPSRSRAGQACTSLGRTLPGTLCAMQPGSWRRLGGAPWGTPMSLGRTLQLVVPGSGKGRVWGGRKRSPRPPLFIVKTRKRGLCRPAGPGGPQKNFSADARHAPCPRLHPRLARTHGNPLGWSPAEWNSPTRAPHSGDGEEAGVLPVPGRRGRVPTPPSPTRVSPSFISASAPCNVCFPTGLWASSHFQGDSRLYLGPPPQGPQPPPS